MSSNAPLSLEQIKKIRRRPEIFFYEFLGVDRLEVYHKRILDAFIKYDRISIAATHAVGKTWITARIALFFLTMYKNSIVITTAPTNRQVKKLLWGELRSAHKNAKRALGGRLLQTELIINDEWYAMGFSPQKEAGEGKEQSGSSFQGFHSKFILIIFDEATGLPADVWKMAEGLLTSGKIVKFVAIGNPTTRNCEFYKCFKSYDWFKIYLSCFDSPNMIENNLADMDSLLAEIDKIRVMGDEQRLAYIQSYKKPVPYLLSAQWVVSKALEWGVNHPLFLSKVLGQFPREEDNVLIQLGEVEAAVNREVEVIAGTERYIGVDVARYGEDKTIFVEIVGKKNTRIKKLLKKSNTEVVGELINFCREKYGNPVEHPTTLLIDGTGVGSGVIDILKERKREGLIPSSWKILELHNASSCDGGGNPKRAEEEKSRYANIKAKMYDDLAKDIRSGLTLLEDSEFLIQLPNIKFKFDSKGRLIVESKDDYKERTGQGSPDEADALALANFGRYYSGQIGDPTTIKKLTESTGKPDTNNHTLYNSRVKPRFEH